MKKVPVLVLLVLVAVLGFQIWSCNQKVQHVRKAQRIEDEHARQLDELLARPPLSAQMPGLPRDPIARRQALQDAMRLRPDGRFLLALEELAGHAEAHFEGGQQWRISAAGKEIGRVAELPDFASQFGMLAPLAKTWLEANGISGPPAAPGRALRDERDALDGLRRAQQSWAGGDRSRARLHEAAAFAAALTFYLVDSMEVADAFAGHALVLVALDAAAGNPAQGAETVIAAALGYRGAALSIARELQGEAALRHYLAAEDARLEESAWLREATAAERFLRLRRLVELGDEAGVKRWLDGAPADERLSTAVLGQLAIQGRMNAFAGPAFAGPVFLAARLRGVALLDATGTFEEAFNAAMSTSAQALQLTKASDTVQLVLDAIDKLDPGANGPLLRQDDLRKWFAAALVSSLRAQERYFTDAQGNRNSTRQFAAWLGRYKDRRVSELQAFAKARGADRAAAVFEALAQTDHLAGSATAKLLELAGERAEYANPHVIEAVLASARRFDSRIDHRIHWAGVRYARLADVSGARALLESVQLSAARTDAYAALFLAQVTLDPARYRALAEDRALPLGIRGAAVDAYERLAPAKDAERLVRAYADEHPDRWSSREPLVRFLRHQKRLEEARTEALDWVRRWDEPSRGLEPVHARCAASRESWEMHRFDDGLSDIEPAVRSWAFCALRMAAYHLAKLDRKEEANRLAEAMVSRYAGASAMSNAAFVYWTEGDLQGAARVLANRNATLTSEDVRFKVGPLFADVFQQRPADARAAVNALHGAHLEPWYALDLGVALENRGAYEGAFKVATAFEVPANGPRQQQLLHAASALRKWRGEQAAREWLTEQIGKPVTPRAAYDLAMIAYREDRDALIFALPDPDGDPGTVETVWLFRAAALKRLGNKADAKARGAVNAHYAGSGEGRPFELGRYLLGRVPEAELTRIAGDAPAASCEVPYYAGAKAEAEKRMDDASSWYLTAISCLRWREAEYLWAYDSLRRLRDRRQPEED